MRKHSWLPLSALVIAQAMNPALSRADFVQTNLVSDIPGLAQVTDPNLKNPWGVSFSGNSPIWVSNQASNTTTLYNPLSSGITVPLVVDVPGAGATGQVFNSTNNDFQIAGPGATGVKSLFLFATLNGTIQGWNPGSNSGMLSTETAATVPGAVFTGLALGSSGGENFLYAADATGRIAVFDSAFKNVTDLNFAGKFTDPNAVAGFTPYNIQNLDGNLFVTYASPTEAGGFVDEFDTSGKFVQRVVTNGPLDGAWGLALAPAGFGSFGGDLLVGNLANSQINAFDLANGNLDGTIQVNTGFASPVGLWAIAFGNGVTGNANTLYFAAGINNQADGLLGAISIPEPSFLPLLSLGIAGLALFYGRRRNAAN